MSNDPPASDNPTLEPGALINSDGNYCLQHADVIALLKYVWTGVLLPTDMAEFKERVHLKGDFEQELVPGITQLLEHYKVIQAHNKTFKDTTYPGITALAGQVKDYADTVGGNPDTSYYALLLQSCLDLDTELKKPNPDQQRVADLKDTIKGIVDDQLASIETLQTAASVATQSLRDYEEQTKKDQQDLKTTKDELDLILKGPGGEITTLDSDLAAKRQELSDDQAEYEHGR